MKDIHDIGYARMEIIIHSVVTYMANTLQHSTTPTYIIITNLLSSMLLVKQTPDAS